MVHMIGAEKVPFGGKFTTNTHSAVGEDVCDSMTVIMTNDQNDDV